MAEKFPTIRSESVEVEEEERLAMANAGVQDTGRMEVDEGRQGMNQERWERMIEEDQRALEDTDKEQERFPSMLRPSSKEQHRGEESERAKGQPRKN